MINDAVHKRAIVPLYFEKLQTVLSPILIGILNLEWEVRLPSMIEAAMPDVAVATAVRPIDRTLASNALYKKVLPVPPGSSTKKTPTSLINDMLHNCIKTKTLFNIQ
jgi:hypothetical protein